MLKVRYLFITMWIYYLLYALVSVVIESYIIEDTVRELESDMRVAGDMAIQQTQFLDDFLSFRPDTAYELLMPTSSQGVYEKTDVFEAMYGVTVNSEDDLDTVYNAVYNNNDFARVAKLSSKDMQVGLRWYDQAINSTDGFPTMSWYSIPRVLTLGSDFIKGLSTGTDIWNGVTLTSLEGKSTSPQKRDELVKNYGLHTTVREIEGMKYFNTPLNIGVTYLNKELVSSLFINNMDLLMRQNFTSVNSNMFASNSCAQGTSVGGSADGGVLLKGMSQDVEYDKAVRTENVICTGVLREKMEGENALKGYNPINNGSYTLLRHNSIDKGTVGKLYNGVTAKIEYKVVDMHDSSNNSLLRAVFGNKTSDTSDIGANKADYLKGLNREKLNNFDGALDPLYEKYPFIVAKVTFYADVVIQYKTPLMQQLSLLFDSPDSKGLKIAELRPNSNNTSVKNGIRRFEYTVLFGVAP